MNEDEGEEDKKLDVGTRPRRRALYPFPIGSISELISFSFGCLSTTFKPYSQVYQRRNSTVPRDVVSAFEEPGKYTRTSRVPSRREAAAKSDKGLGHLWN